MAYVIPPLNPGLPSVGIPYYSITPAMLTASSAPEAPPAAYAGGTTYALDAEVSVAVGAANAFDVYRSLQPGNTGNTPSSSPLWWRLLGRTYGAYSGGATYALDDFVVDATDHYEYKSLVAGNNGNPLTDNTKWQRQGATNRFRMFDLLKNNVTTAPSLVVEITPGQRVSGIGAIGVRAKSVLIEVIVASVVKWSTTETLSTRFTTGWRSYFFGGFSYKTKFANFELPPYSSATIRLTFTGIGAEDVSVSRIILGSAVYLGRTIHAPRIGKLNFSKVDRDSDGNSEITPKRSIPRITKTIRFDRAKTDQLLKLGDDLNAIPALWSGLDDSAHGYFGALLGICVYKVFELDLDRPEEALLNVELEEA